MKVFIKWLMTFILILVVVTVLFFYWLSKTEPGLNWALKQADAFVTFDRIEGELGDFSFSGMRLNAQKTKVTVASGQGAWQPWSLITKSLAVNQLNVNDVQIVLEPSAQEPQSYQPWQGLNLPINAKFDSLTINALTVVSDTKTIYELETANLTATFNNNLLDISELTIVAKNNQQSIQGQIDLSAKAQGVISLQNSIQLQLAERNFDVSGEIDGNWQSFDVRQTITSDAIVLVDLKVKDSLSERLSWSGKINSDVTSVALNNEQNISLGEGRFDTTGEFSPAEGLSTLDVTLSGELNGGNETLSFWDLITDLSYQGGDLTISSLRLLEQPAHGEGELVVAGEIVGVSDFIQQTNSSSATADLSGQWQSLGWSFAQAQHVLQTDGQFSFKGVPHDFSLLANAEGTSYQKPFNLQVDLNVVDRAVLINAAKIQSNQSTLTLSGRAGFDELALSDTIGLSDTTALSEVKTLSELMHQQLAINWKIDSPSLQDLSPQLSGDLRGQGKITGTLSNPIVEVTASSTILNYLNYQISDLSVDLGSVLELVVGSVTDSLPNESKANKIDQLKGYVEVGKVSQNGKLLADNINLIVEQENAKNEITLEARLIERSQLILDANFSYAINGMQIELNQLMLADPEYDTWRLEAPITISQKTSIAGQVWSWQEACLKNTDQAVCVDASLGLIENEINGTIASLNLASFNPLLNLYQMSVTGEVNGAFSYQLEQASPIPQINVSLNLRDTVLTLPQNNTKDSLEQKNRARVSNRKIDVPKDVRILSGSLLINQQTSFAAELSLDLENDDRIAGKLNVVEPFGSDGFMDSALNGKLLVDIDKLSDWSISTNVLSDFDGQLNADIDLTGSLSEPSVGMQTRLTNARAKIPQLGIDFRDINIQATSEADRNIVVVGELISGDGTLNIDGQLDFARLNEPRVSVYLQGENLNFMQTKEVAVVGDIDTRLDINSKLIKLEGTINIDEAELDFAVPEGAVVASKDVVLMGEEKQAGTAQEVNLTINLGQKTAIKAQGLEGFLRGRLTLLQEPGGLLRGRGQIDINEGHYTAYGQDFDIDKGQLLFNNGAVENPRLDINAQKEVDAITAGVSVSGTASGPILSLYSTPSMPDQDILSVLIFGRKLNNLSSQDGLTLLKIANSLRGGGEGNIAAITDKIQDTFGLSELELLVDDGSPTIRAGKQLSSQFYIGYGYGLLDAAQSLILRYKINQAWSIQGDVGADSGADLRYQIQR